MKVFGTIKEYQKQLAEEYKNEISGKKAYHFLDGVSHTSPCMSLYWRSKPIRQGKIIDSEHDKIKDIDEETENEIVRNLTI